MKRYLAATLLFLFCLFVYTANFRVVGAGDCWANRYIPISILREGNLDLNEFPGVRFQVWDWTRKRQFRIPIQPVLPGISATPVYAVADIFGIPFTPINVAFLGKLSASIYTALSAAILLIILLRLLPSRQALLLALAYAFGTCAWTVSSQDLWQHGLSQFLLVSGLACLVNVSDRPRRVGLSGLFFSFAVITRGMNIPIAFLMFIYIVFRYPKKIAVFLLWCLPAAIFYLSFNLYYLGSPFNSIVAYALGYFQLAGIPGSFSGLLFSPARGLLFFSPFFLLAGLGAVMGWRKTTPGWLLYRFLAIAAGGYIIFLSAWHMWWGGYCYGYRMLVDITPILVLLMVPAAPLLKRPVFLIVFIIFLLWALLLQVAGSLYYCDRWNGRRHIDRHPERLWWISGGQVDFMLRYAAARGWCPEKKVRLPSGHRSEPYRVPKGAAK